MRHKPTLASPRGEPRNNPRGRILAAITSLACAALATPAAAQQCSPAYPDVVAAMYAQVMELGGGSDGLQGWTGALITGHTVKHMVASNVKWTGYDERHMNGRTSEEKLTNLYRHLLAREPDDAAWGWIGVGEDPNQGWDDVVDGLMNGAEYMAKFGDHVVPGDPVVAWDCTRATGLTVAHTQGFRDAGQGGASVSYTTPAYVSLDQPRSLTFSFYTGLTDPRSQMQLNVLHASADAPGRVQVEVRNREGARETLTNDWRDVAFWTGQGASRVSAEFREPRFTNLNATYTAVVRRYWADGRSTEDRVPFRAANLDARGSEFGHGWVLEGLQRLYDQGDGVHITEGATGLWFAQKGPGSGSSQARSYSAPSGDFSTVMKDDTGAYHRSYPDGTRVRFRRDGRMHDVADRFGNVTLYRYDSAGRLDRVTDPVGNHTTLGYTGAGALSWVQDPAGRRVTTASNGAVLWRFRDPAEVSGADGPIALDLQFMNTAKGHMVLDTYWTAVGDRNAGAHTGYTFAYDAHGRVASVTAPQVKVTEPGVGDSVPMRPVVKSRSLQMAILGTGALSSPVARVRPENIRVEVTDARNNTTRMAVDPLGIPVRVEEPRERVSRGTTDRHGRMMRSVSPSENTTVVEYSGVEPRKTIDEGTGAVVQMTYEPTFHQLTRAWGTGTTEVEHTYDTSPQRKLLTSRNGPAGTPVTHYTFDARGRIKTAMDPEGHGTTYTYGGQPGSTYDNLRTVNTGSSLPRTTTTVYDRFGRDSLKISPANETARTEYDLLNRVTRTVDPVGGATVYRYMNGQLYQVTDPKLQTYSFHRDMLGRLGSEVDPRGGWSYTYYDRAGNPTFMKNRRGQVVTARYDVLNQRAALYTSTTDSTTWRYDPNGLWMEARNSESVNRVEFDVAGRARRALTTLGSVTYTQVITPDVIGRRLQMDLSFPGTHRSIAQTYNARGQLQTMRDIGGGTTTFTYNADGQEDSRSLPNGLMVGHDYPSTHVTSGVAYSETTLNARLGLGYHHNLNGQVDGRRMADLASPDGSTEVVRRYEYDPRGWMKSFLDERVTAPTAGTCSGASLEDEDGGACMPPRGGTAYPLAGHTYTYDEVGNRKDSGATLDGNRMTGLDSYTLSYDLDGNLIQKVKGSNDLVLTWNKLGQMVSAASSQRGTAYYGYDAFGRRVRRTAPNGTVVRYLYDGDDLLAELDGATGQTIREYTYYPGVDRPHSVRVAASGASYYYATDHPGNVVGLINAAQQLENEYRYVHFGEVQVVQENIGQPLRFAAREWDDVPGLYQVRARWYDPQSGRFVSEDPIGLAGGINPYLYGNNDPINLRDPSGLECTAGDFDGGTAVTVPCASKCPDGWTKGTDGVCRSARGGGGSGTGGTGSGGSGGGGWLG